MEQPGDHQRLEAVRPAGALASGRGGITGAEEGDPGKMVALVQVMGFFPPLQQKRPHRGRRVCNTRMAGNTTPDSNWFRSRKRSAIFTMFRRSRSCSKSSLAAPLERISHMNTTDHTGFTHPQRIDIHHHIIPPVYLA